MNKKPSTHPQLMWLPLAIAVAAVIGIFIGNRFSSKQYAVDNDRKLNLILNLIETKYVDTVNINDLIEMSIPEILSNLDPHTIYLTKEDLKQANSDLKGSFGGVGISFMIMHDTINVIEVIPGGPSEKVGIQAGDRIVTVNDSSLVGKKATNSEVMKQLRGANGTKVKLGIMRGTSRDINNFTVTRGEIPTKSVDAAYMIDKTTGYIKVNTFGAKTYNEFLTGMGSLREEGAKRYIIDLRGNGGGYMEMAIYLANEFLPKDQLIVYTHGRSKANDNKYYSDGNGQFQEDEVIVLMDEFSASASEIFAGALQDNDRALIMGCRSFGKGLVQEQIDLPDSSAIRLTIARYYTPSGRCIQKDYKGTDYSKDIINRYNSGEIFNQDSIKIDKSQVFTTLHGRNVYGGGGITPDIFVARDTTGFTPYYIEVSSQGLIQQFAYQYANRERKTLEQKEDYKEFLRTEPATDAILNDFVDFATQNDVAARWYYINLSRDLIVTQIKAIIARDIYGSEAFYPIFNRNDNTLQAAIKAFNKHKAAYPITAEEGK